MSNNWVDDIKGMDNKFEFDQWINDNLDNRESLRKFLEFRLEFIREEFGETVEAFNVKDSEEIVDGLIDMCFVIISTLGLFKVDVNKAWDEVLKANLKKGVGVKPNRPNPLNLPDLLKPKDWAAPSHENNHGIFNII